MRAECDICTIHFTTATEQSAAEDTGQVSQDEEYMDMNEYEVVTFNCMKY